MTTTTTRQCGARAARAMGLFDDLPSAKRDAPASARDDSPAAKRATAAETDADRTRARSSDPVKSRAEPALMDGARNPERGAASHAEALERLAAHIANPAKFKRASALAAELMRSGELERRHGKSVFALLDAAMTPPSRAADPRTRFEYRDLFAAAERCADEGVLNAKHAKRLRGVFLVYVNLVNRAFTDDAFEFARFAKDVADRFDALPPYEPEPVAPEEPESSNGASAYDVHGNAPGSSGGGASEARATALRMRRAESAAAREDWRVVDGTREALLFAVESARSRYRLAWAQSTVDVLIGKVDALERACARFGPDQRDRFLRARDAARAERDARRAGGGAGEKSERATAFDRDAAAYRNASVSARGGVGGEGTRDGRGESAIR